MPDRPEDILDRCIDASRFGSDPEAILREHPEVAREVRPLLELASALEASPEPPVSQTKLLAAMAKATELGSAHDAHRRCRTRLFSTKLWSRAAAVIVIFLLLGWGAATASAGSLPGELLYPVKLFTERVKFFLTLRPEEKAELRIIFSEERLKEAIKKYRKGGGLDRETLKAMLDEAQHALEAVPEAPTTERSLLESRVRHLSDFQRQKLEELQRSVRPSDREVLQPFIDSCRRRCGRHWRRRVPSGAPQDPSGGAQQGGCSCPWCR